MHGYDVVKWHSTPELSTEFYAVSMGKFTLDSYDSKRMHHEIENPKRDFKLIPIVHKKRRNEIDSRGFMWSYIPNYRFPELRSRVFKVSSEIFKLDNKSFVDVVATEFINEDGIICLNLTSSAYKKPIVIECDLFPENDVEVEDLLRYRVK